MKLKTFKQTSHFWLHKKNPINLGISQTNVFFLASENVSNTCLVPNELNLAHLKKSDHPFA
jgi:hypothetical protein